MPRGVAVTREKTVDDLSEQELKVFNKLPDEESQEWYLSTLPPVKVNQSSASTHVDKSKSLNTRRNAVVELLSAYEEYLGKVDSAIADNDDGKDVDLMEVKRLPELSGWTIVCGAGRAPYRSRVKTSKNGNSETEEEVSNSDDEEGTVIGRGKRGKRG